MSKCCKCREDSNKTIIIEREHLFEHELLSKDKGVYCVDCCINLISDNHAGKTSAHHKICQPKTKDEVNVYNAKTAQQFLGSVGRLMEKTTPGDRYCWVASLPKDLASFVMTEYWTFKSHDFKMAEKVRNFLSYSDKNLTDYNNDTNPRVYGNLVNYEKSRYVVYPKDTNGCWLDIVELEMPLIIIPVRNIND